MRVLLHELLVYEATLLCTEVFICHDASDDVMLIEWTHPSLGDLILDLVLDLDLVGALC